MNFIFFTAVKNLRINSINALYYFFFFLKRLWLGRHFLGNSHNFEYSFQTSICNSWMWKVFQLSKESENIFKEHHGTINIKCGVNTFHRKRPNFHHWWLQQQGHPALNKRTGGLIFYLGKDKRFLSTDKESIWIFILHMIECMKKNNLLTYCNFRIMLSNNLWHESIFAFLTV
jgi:hypothetical protein